MSSTAPNGWFDLCVPDLTITLVDVTPPTQASAYSSTPGIYTMPTIDIASKNVLFVGGAWSGRAFVMGRPTEATAKA